MIRGLDLNYIILDLEWNNAYSYAKKGFMNEIIEIGAIKLNDRFDVVDTFKQLIKPKITKKLSSRCKNITNITNEQLNENGIPFTQAIKDFARWCQNQDNIFLTWSNSDLYVLAENYQLICLTTEIGFITKYCDAQKYCMAFVEKEDKNQISLAKCAELLGVEIDTQKLHRALADCYVTAECLKKVYDKNKLLSYTVNCDKYFFERLIYKPYIITKPKTELFNVYDVKLVCPKCSAEMTRLKNFECVNKSFRCPTKCPVCNKIYWTTVRAKKKYDEVEVSQRSIEMNKKRAKKIKPKENS